MRAEADVEHGTLSVLERIIKRSLSHMTHLCVLGRLDLPLIHTDRSVWSP